ncbi:Major sperm protein (MSP) domain,Immunoglobulin-like fold,PapD-like [Cinara cedri]|uniref:Major sperm protein (MSP) domain,Immunoglobulin-like fold,PapD-like n=1 Tax=Cinara cedri TaxID=506608 RepID=A0A5E4MCM2_9HEMI|nr:Major sperm protein (MSP) domain,Immunoglobulin-like fold,PapD-like [Cinara cedri]
MSSKTEQIVLIEPPHVLIFKGIECKPGRTVFLEITPPRRTKIIDPIVVQTRTPFQSSISISQLKVRECDIANVSVYIAYGSFTEPVQAVMVLNNPSNKKIAFKIKTTAPKGYYARPNYGELIPKEKAEILVILQPFNYDANEKNKHRFLVQTVVLLTLLLTMEKMA